MRRDPDGSVGTEYKRDPGEIVGPKDPGGTIGPTKSPGGGGTLTSGFLLFL